MILGTIYIFVPLKANDDGWVKFNNKIALYNKSYDEKIIGKEPSEKFNQAYIDDLQNEYERLKKLFRFKGKGSLWQAQSNLI